MTTTTLTKIQALTAELAAAMGDMQVGTDSGTHSMPATHDVFERIDGSRYAICNFAGAKSMISAAAAEERTDGRIRNTTHDSLASRTARVAELKKMIKFAARKAFGH